MAAGIHGTDGSTPSSILRTISSTGSGLPRFPAMAIARSHAPWWCCSQASPESRTRAPDDRHCRAPKRSLLAAASRATAIGTVGTRKPQGRGESVMKKQVVIVGGGFGGLRAARALKSAPVDVTLIDRRNYHLFQPLLYQVATGSLSPGDIAAPIRGVLGRQKNNRKLLGDEVDKDGASRRVLLADGGDVSYDVLIVAAGTQSSYYGHEEWRQWAPSLKSIEEATEIRHKILYAFEAAERIFDP